MAKILNDKDLEGVNGGVELEGLSKVPENDYSVVYKKDGSSEPDKPIDAGKYKIEIAIDKTGNYQEQFNEENNGFFSFDIAQPDIRWMQMSWKRWFAVINFVI